MGRSKPAGENSIKGVEKLRARVAKLEQVSRELATRKGAADSEVDKAWREWEKTFDATKDSIMVIDSQFKVVQANLATSRLLGKPLDEIVGKTCWEVVHGTEQRPKECPLKKAQHTKQHKEAELYVPQKDVWIEVAVDPILDDQGNVTKIVHVVRDITDRKKTEQALRESEQKHREIVELAPDGMVTVDLNGTITSCNSALLEKTGYSKEDFVGKHISRIPTARVQDMPKYLKIFGSLLLGKVPKPFQFVWIHRDGTEHRGELRVSIMKRNGKTTGFQAITRDLTERRKAEEAYRALVDHSLQGLAIFQEGRVVFANPAMAEITGYTVDEMLAMQPEEVYAFVHPGDRELVWNRHKDRLAGRALPERYELRGVRKNGSICWLEIHASRIEYQAKPAIQAAYIDITERKEAEDALQASEHRYRALFENAGEGIITVDLDGRITAANRLVEEYGFDREELIGRKLFDFVPEYDKARAVTDFQALLVGTRVKGQMDVITPKGIRTVEYRDTPIVRAGAVVGVQAILTDITERKKAEEKLKQYQFMVESAHDAIFFKDLESRYIIANDKVLEAFGLSRQQIIGKNDYEVLANEAEAKKNIEDDKIVFKTGEPVEINKLMTGADGKQRWFQAIKVPQFDDKGRIVGLVGIARDITERKKAEQLLRKERDRAQTYLDVAGVMLVAIDSEQRVGLINKKGCEILGYSEEEIVAKNWFDNFLPERIRDEVRAVFQRLVAGEPDAPQYYENPILTKTGDERLVAWHNTILRDEKGRVIATLGSGEDITERKRTEQELQRTQQEKTGILDTMLEHVVYRDLEMKVLWANRAAGKSVGLVPEQLAGRHCYEIWHQRSAPCVVCPAKLALRSGQREEMEVTTPDGRIWFIRAYPIRDANAQIIGIANTTLEISERKKANEALRESEEKFKGIFEHANDGIIYLDSTGKILDVNARSIQMFGGAKQEVVGKHFTELGIFSADDIRTLMSNFEAVVAGKKASLTVTVTNKKGQQIVLECSASLTKEPGRAARIMVIARDITERKKAEQQIEKLAKFPAEDPYPVLRVSGHGTVIYANKASLPLLKAWSCRVGHPLPDPWLSFVLDALSSGQSLQAEVQCDGRTFSLVFAPIMDANYVNIYGLDITDRKQAEEKLREDQAQLKSLASQLTLTEERERRRIATELHDRISQSLVISKIRLEGLRQSTSDQQLIGALNDVCSTLDKTMADTRDLTLDLSCPILYELGLEAAVSEWLIEEVEKKYHIRAEFEDDGQAKPLNDDLRALLFRNVRELLVNVIKHAHAKKVKVCIEKLGGQIRITVEDDGAGFDPGELVVAGARQRRFGLFSIRERLEQLAGHLEIDSSPGCGSRVIMTAPLRRATNTNGG